MKKRTKLRDRVLPDYTRSEEIFHMVSHISGGAFAYSALVVCVAVAAYHRSGWGIAGGIVYGTTMILLYTMSSIYHGLIPENPKKVFQIIDHCAIFFLIAGTYTPIAFGPLRLAHPYVAWGMFAFMWVVCALGVTLNAIDLKKFQAFSLICYVGMGWSMVIFVRQLLDVMPLSDFLWLLSGGLSFTIGAVLYMLGKKFRMRYMHSVYHLFVVLGSVLQFVCILKTLSNESNNLNFYI
ncbi:MAG: hemolysin III family protein [Oscillospiraceae bacterium]|nr:hemolysin III family protein [Oscillospiraceae bacterium]